MEEVVPPGLRYDQSSTLGRKNAHLEHIPWQRREDVMLMIIQFIIITIAISVIFTTGHLRGWNAHRPHYYNGSTTSLGRFADLPVHKKHNTAHKSRVYYWKLKPELRTTVSLVLPWIGYVSHQLCIWFCIYWAQRARENGRIRYGYKLNRYHILPIVFNTTFLILHFVQCHITYDGLASQVTTVSPECSIMMMCVFILIIEYKNRGIIMGWPSRYSTWCWAKYLKLPYQPMILVRKYHGYGFAWAAIWTMWYHPTENTIGHIAVLFHCWIILLQGTLLYTQIHLNRYWRLITEIWTTISIGSLAYQLGSEEMQDTMYWPTYVFGFLLLLVLTQFYGLSFWKKIPPLFRLAPLLNMSILIIWCYSWIPDKDGYAWKRLPEIFIIPAILYAAFLITYLFLLLISLCVSCAPYNKVRSDEEYTCHCSYAICYGIWLYTLRQSQVIHVLKFFITIMFFTVYLIFITISVWLERNLQGIADLIKIPTLLAIFVLGQSVVTVMLNHIFPTQRDEMKRTTETDKTGFTHTIRQRGPTNQIMSRLENTHSSPTQSQNVSSSHTWRNENEREDSFFIQARF